MTFFYDLNKRLAAVSPTPATTQLNERDEGKHNNATTGFKALADKAAKEYGSKAAGERVAGAVHAKMAKAGKLEEQDIEEGLLDTVKQVGKKVAGGINKAIGHGSDEDMIRDLQKKAGVPQTGKKPAPQQQVKEKVDPVAFAALAEPKDKITFADKIAGAKKEVDEMLGDVAAEAMKNAIAGKLNQQEEVEEGWDDMIKDVEARRRAPKVGDKYAGARHDITTTATGRIATRRQDDEDEPKAASGEKRKAGRPANPNKAPERVTAKAYKHKGGRKEKVEEGPDEGMDMVKLAKVIASCTTQAQLDTARRMAQNFLKKHQTGDLAFYGSDMKRGQAVAKDIANKRDEIGGVKERKLSSSEKEEREDIVKGMKKNKAGFEKDYGKRAKDVMYATATKMAKERGPGNPDRKKKEESVDETTTSGSVATAPSKGKSNSVVGKGIYDSINREVEAMISESISVNMSMNNDGGKPSKSITVTATDEDANKLSQLLAMAGLGGGAAAASVATGHEEEACSDCGSALCDCDHNGEVEIEMGEAAVDVTNNEPDWPTDKVGSDDALQYSGGLNKPKSTGQTTIPVIAGQDGRTSSYAEEEEDAIKRMMEMAGVTTESKKPDFLDVDKDGDKAEPFKKAVDDKKKADDKKVEESLMREFNNFKI